MPKVEYVKNYDDLFKSLKADYIEYSYFPNVYLIEEKDKYIIWSGSPDFDKSIRIYTFKKWNEKSFEMILERETRNIDNHRIKVYEYLVSNYNNTNELINFEDFEL